MFYFNRKFNNSRLNRSTKRTTQNPIVYHFPQVPRKKKNRDKIIFLTILLCKKLLPDFLLNSWHE